MSDVVELDGQIYEYVGGDWYEVRTKIKVTQSVSNWLNLHRQNAPVTKSAKRIPELKYPYDVLANAEKNRSVEGQYHVYVILMSEMVKQKAGVPLGTDPRKACVYVGQSFHTPKERFAKHKSGHKAGRYVARYGMCLMPELYEKYNPIETRQQAEAIEAALAQKLRLQGYTVLGGH